MELQAREGEGQVRALGLANAAIVAMAFASAAAAWPQSDTSGAVRGSVTDPGGQPVAGAAVRLENTASGDFAETASDAAGDFQFAEVVPGSWRVLVHAPGLADWEADNLSVGPGTTAQLNARLSRLTEHRTVLVDARRAGADAENNESGALGQSWLDALPNNGRQTSSLAALLGPSSPDANGGLSFRGLSPLLNSFTVDGTDNTLAFRARERGTEGNGFTTGPSAVAAFQADAGSFSAEHARAAGGQMTTITRGGSNRMRGHATFFDRGAIGQAANAYSKVMETEPAGTTATATGEPVQYLNGQPITYVDVPIRVPDRRQQWEVSAGGPIRRQRAWWFFAWEQHDRSDPAIARASEPQVFFFPASQAALATLEARLARAAVPNPLVSNCPPAAEAPDGSTAAAECAYSSVLNQLGGMLGSVPRSTRQTIVFPRIDWRVSDRNQLELQYNTMRRTAPHGALSGASEMDGIGSFGNSSTSDDAAVARWDLFASARWINSARFQFSRDVLAQTPGTPSPFERNLSHNAYGLPPQISIDPSQGFSFGTLSTVNKREYPAETRQQFRDAATWVHRRQALRFGYDSSHIRDALEGMNGENGEYSYASLVDFVSDLLAPDSCDGASAGAGPYPCYSRFRQNLGDATWWFTTADYAAYAAEEWKTGRGLTLTAGLRYEYEQLPDTNSALANPAIPETAALPHNHADFAPRAGFSWDVLGRGTTVLRGGFGIFYGRIPNATVFSALTATGSVHSPRAYSWRPMDVGAPPFPYVFAGAETPYTDPQAPDQQSTAPEVVYFDPHFRHPQIDDAELDLQQNIGRQTLLTLTAMATNGHHLTQFVDTNIDLSATAPIFYAVKGPDNLSDAGPLSRFASSASSFPIYSPQHFYYRRLNPAYGSITNVLSESNSSYRGLMVRLMRPMSRAVSINAGYTWAHAIDDNQTESAFADRNDIYDPADLRLEHGTSNFDVRQRVAGGIVLREPWRPRGGMGLFLGGYTLAATGAWRTGLPYSMRSAGSTPTPSCSYQDWLIAGGATGHGGDCLKAVTQPNGVIVGAAVPIAGLGPGLNGSGGEDLILPIGRNTFRYPAAANLDLRLTKRFRLSDRYAVELLGEAFNALNHENVTSLQTVGYRISGDTQHANMANLIWESGMKPGSKVQMVNGTSVTEPVFDATAAFGGPTNANSMALQRERQIQAGLRLTF